MTDDAEYLQPYIEAVHRHGSRFPSLLWASRQSQALRFEALTRIVNFAELNVCDAGCGQADLLDYLISRKIFPSHYVGIEAMDEHIAEARKKSRPDCIIVKADFVREPHRLLVGADVIVFCGSLNTLKLDECRQALRHAFAAAGQAIVFNFLSSGRLASANWLTWHPKDQMLQFAQTLAPDLADVTLLDDYLDGDCTICIDKPRA